MRERLVITPEHHRSDPNMAVELPAAILSAMSVLNPVPNSNSFNELPDLTVIAQSRAGSFSDWSRSCLYWARTHAVHMRPRRLFMVNRIFKLVLSVGLLTGTVWAANDPFAGKWKLDPSRSRLTDQMKVEAAGPNKYSLIFSGDNVETVVADGTDQPGLFGTTLAVSVEGPDDWKVVRKSNGRTTITGLWTLSDNDSILTDNFTSYRPDGSTFHLNYIYKRTAGTSGFPGTWESTTEQVNSSYEVQIEPYQNSGLSFVYPSGITKSVNFDGKDYPTSGSNAAPGSTTSAQRVNEKTLQMTDKINGKVRDTQQVELSPDGKTLTMTVSIPGRSKPNIMVFDRE